MNGRGAFWYDFGDPGLCSRRAAFLAGRLEESGYDGLFFDTLGFEQLPPSMREEYTRRHPGRKFNTDQGAFLAEFRQQAGPDCILFTNQGYRQPDDFLDHADFDLSESYFTYSSSGHTRFRPWYDSHSPWESVRVPMEELIVPAARRFPNVRFIHLNYAAGSEEEVRRAIRYSNCCARLWSQGAYLVGPSPAGEVDDIYFTDPGAPRDQDYQEDVARGLAWRRYERGVVAVNSSRRPQQIPDTGLEIEAGPIGLIFERD